MNPLFSLSGLPLLGKELIEQANRRRTYVVRFLYTAALFGCGLMILYGRGGLSVDASARLGEGRGMFLSLVWLQFAGIHLFLPAMTAGALTAEKERDTLTLLLLTPMKPWAILIQKLLSRVIPMLCFVILSFPLMAVAYSYGGVTTGSLYAAMFLLVLVVVQVASVSLMCSAYCRTTVEAFLLSYLVLIGLSLTCVPMLMVLIGRSFAGLQILPATVMTGLVTAGCLLAARGFLFTRAFVPPRNVLLQFFHALDGMFNEMNKVTGGVIVVRDGSPYPEARPVAWRETAKKSLGTFRYLFRVLVVLQLPVLFVAQELRINAIQNHSVLTFLLYLLWVIGVAMICIHAASVVSSERSRQTLDSLLTAPIAGADLLRQKLAGVRRLSCVLLVPFVTIFLVHHWLRDYRGDYTYLILSLASAVILFQFTAWSAFWIGLRVRSQMKAVFTTLAAAAALAGLPRLFEFLAESLRLRVPEGLVWAVNVSPATLVQRLESWHVYAGLVEAETVREQAIILGLILAGYAAATLVIRRHCLTHADSLLGRVSQDRPLPPPRAA